MKNLLSYFLIGLVIFGVFYFFKNSTVNKSSAISGTINFTGLKPDPGDKGSVVLKYRNYKDTNAEYKSTNLIIPLKDDEPYSWKEAKEGQSYSLVAELVIDGKTVKVSDAVDVTAPAVNLIIPLKVTWRDLPTDVVNSQTVKMSGKITVNGLIPKDSKVAVEVKEGTGKYQYVANLPATEFTDWSWEEAKPLKNYSIRAVLNSTGVSKGVSSEVEATAGESEVNLVINSTASNVTPTPKSEPTKQVISKPTSAPVVKGKISGEVVINGPKAANTTLLMLWRHPGEKDFKVITRLSNPDSGKNSWSWEDANVGREYEITTALQVNESNTASARSQIVTAPASSVNFTLNTGISVRGTSGTPEKESCNKVNDNEYDVTIKWPKESDAGKYWFQLGENPSWSNRLNQKISADGNTDNKRSTIRINKDRNYYAQYAFSYCANCDADSNFSSFSNPFRFYCGNDPSGNTDYKGYICNGSTYACELTKDSNPPYNFNNEGLTQCQYACGKLLPQ